MASRSTRIWRDEILSGQVRQRRIEGEHEGTVEAQRGAERRLERGRRQTKQLSTGSSSAGAARTSKGSPARRAAPPRFWPPVAPMMPRDARRRNFRWQRPRHAVFRSSSRTTTNGLALCRGRHGEQTLRWRFRVGPAEEVKRESRPSGFRPRRHRNDRLAVLEHQRMVRHSGASQCSRSTLRPSGTSSITSTTTVTTSPILTGA